MNSGLRRTEFNSRDRRRNAGVGRKNHNEELEKPRQVNLSACLTIQSPPPGGQNARLDAAATDQQYLEPLGRCPGRSHHAGRTRRGLCLERISHSAEQGLRLDHFPGHVYVHSGDSDAGFRGVCGRIMDEEIRSPPGPPLSPEFFTALAFSWRASRRDICTGFTSPMDFWEGSV